MRVSGHDHLTISIKRVVPRKKKTAILRSRLLSMIDDSLAWANVCVPWPPVLGVLSPTLYVVPHRSICPWGIVGRGRVRSRKSSLCETLVTNVPHTGQSTSRRSPYSTEETYVTSRAKRADPLRKTRKTRVRPYPPFTYLNDRGPNVRPLHVFCHDQ